MDISLLVQKDRFVGVLVSVLVSERKTMRCEVIRSNINTDYGT